MIWLAIGLAGAAGAVCRYVVDFIVTARVETVFPFGTFLVNLSGSLLFGLVAGLATRRPPPRVGPSSRSGRRSRGG
ncbi:MAG: hypothetical protein GEU81_18450 [Nitriliruptorales bacterium]|nr:hypothetical protein [Nitriliruptorales bacterium]